MNADERTLLSRSPDAPALGALRAARTDPADGPQLQRHPVHFTEFDTRLAAYGLLTTDDGQILLTWFNGNAQAEAGWTMPGGRVEVDESIRDAVVREVFEETGYTVEVGRIIAEHHLTVPHTAGRRPFRSQRFLLDATIAGGELGTTEAGGTTGFAKWVPIREVLDLQPRAEIVDVAMAALPGQTA